MPMIADIAPPAREINIILPKSIVSPPFLIIDLKPIVKIKAPAKPARKVLISFGSARNSPRSPRATLIAIAIG